MAGRIAQWLFAAFLLSIGLYLLIMGGQLVMLGGAKYYALAGAALIGVATLTALRNPWAPKLYALITFLTVPWALVESGLDFIVLAPRLASWMVVGLWFVAPWTRSYFAMPAASGDADAKLKKPFRWVELSIASAALLLAVSTTTGYKVEEGTYNEVVADPNPVTDWRNWGGGTSGQRFVQIDQINTKNVGQLEEKWRYRTKVPYDFKATPLMIAGTLYVCTAGNVLIAVDADTGVEKWRHDTKTQVPGAKNRLGDASEYGRTCRGVSYYEAPADYVGECPRRIIGGTIDARLVAVDAETGRSCPTFGFDGSVYLKSGMGDMPEGNYMVTSPPLIAGDLIVTGGWVTDNQQLGNVSGVVRAFNAQTGRFVWAWDMGNPTSNELPDEGGEFTRGTPNVWSIMSFDPKLNLIYAPTGNSSPDYFDGDLRSEAAEKYASGVVALDAATGQAKWNYQFIHRDIWDWDVASQPVLIDLKKDGQIIPALVAPTKRADIFLLDRRDGSPIYPIEERPVPQDPEVGERVSPTQPFSPLPDFRMPMLERDMWGLTPLDHLWCRVHYKRLRFDGFFTPPMRADKSKNLDGSLQHPGNGGGFTWGSVSVDADNGLVVGSPILLANKITLMTPEERAARAAEFLARQPPEARAAAAAAAAGAGVRSPQSPGGSPQDRPEFSPDRIPYTAATAPYFSEWAIPGTKLTTDIPCFEPPWGVMGVIDLNTKKMLWKRRLGSMRSLGPFGIESGLPFQVGVPHWGGSITTRGGLIFHSAATDGTLYALDLRTGKELWKAYLPGPAHTVPMSYVSPASGKQFIVTTVPNPFSYPYRRSKSARPPDPIDDQGGWIIAYGLKDGT